MSDDNMGGLIAEARRAVEFARANRYGQRSHADLIGRLADALEVMQSREAARLRDLKYPEYVPESVTDAAFESQADWYTPGQGDGHAVVLVPKLIETVAEAAYRATLAHQEEVK